MVERTRAVRFPEAVLGALVLGTGGGLGALWITTDDADRELLLSGVGSATGGALVVATVLLVSGYLRLAAARSEHAAHELRKLHSAHRDVRERLLEVGAALDRARDRIATERSGRVWWTELTRVVDAAAALRPVEREISADVRELADPDRVGYLLRVVSDYTDRLAGELAEHREAIAELQRLADQNNQSVATRRRRRARLWDAIVALPVTGDLLATAPYHSRATEGGATRHHAEQEWTDALNSDLRRVRWDRSGPPLRPNPVWFTYRAAEEHALRLLHR
jgi:hypothetical protein